MNRTRTNRDAEPIGYALNILPDPIADRLRHVQFVAGVDPVFVGLHGHESTEDGRPYRETAHACWPCHLQHRPKPERVTTVVLPSPVPPWVVIHELGHALDEALDFEMPRPAPVTAYAQRNGYEAFAEAFTAWVLPDVYPWAGDILGRDTETSSLFNRLATGDI